MSVVELRWHTGRSVTLSKKDILKDLGSAIHEAQGWDPKSSQVDPSTLPTIGVEDAWSRPTETQWADENIFPAMADAEDA